jgi:hypothetical protein
MSVHAGSRWIDANWGELRNYNRQWIAASANGVVASAETPELLVEALGALVPATVPPTPGPQRVELVWQSLTFFFVCFDPLV